MFAVAIGGACGAVLRYFLSQIGKNIAFPLATIGINLLGCFIAGIVFALEIQSRLKPSTIQFFKIGFCGSLTTFSTFSLDTFSLLKHGQYGLALCNISLQVILGIACVIFGFILGKWVTRMT